MKHTSRMQEIITGARRIAAGRAGTSVPQRPPLASRGGTTGNAIAEVLGDAPSFSRWEGRRRAGISAIGRKRTRANARGLKPGGT